jgi:hypothetical protein
MKQNSLFKIGMCLLFAFSANVVVAQNKVEVGTNTPTEKLDVNGNAKADTVKANVVQVVPSAGAGKVFVSDANGNGSWQTGPVGPTGATGATGPSGSNGTNGATGAQGIQGDSGPIGATGAAGSNGTNGAQGIQGDPGPIGATGPAGSNGSNGAQGIQGDPGAAGVAGPTGATGPAGPVAGANTQVIYNNAGVAAGSTGLTFNNGTNMLSTGGATVTSLSGSGLRLATLSGTGQIGASNAGTDNYLTKFTTTGTVGNSLFQDNGTNISVGAALSNLYQLYVYRQQLTANGDGQSTLFGYRTRNTQNDGTGYGNAVANDATRGYNFWGDIYTFGVGGWNYNDYTRCGGVLGAEQGGAYWGSLGYRSSGLLNYGVYGSSAYLSGTGQLPTTELNGIGGGFFGTIGSLSKGSVIGQLNEGELFATYNKGDVYTAGKQIELVSSETSVTPAFAVTSTEVTVYNKGKIQLTNGTATVRFDENYNQLLGETPIVTV